MKTGLIFKITFFSLIIASSLTALISCLVSFIKAKLPSKKGTKHLLIKRK